MPLQYLHIRTIKVAPGALCKLRDAFRLEKSHITLETMCGANKYLNKLSFWGGKLLHMRVMSKVTNHSVHPKNQQIKSERSEYSVHFPSSANGLWDFPSPYTFMNIYYLRTKKIMEKSTLLMVRIFHILV